jgi:hypothetical protein
MRLGMRHGRYHERRLIDERRSVGRREVRFLPSPQIIKTKRYEKKDYS